MNTLQHCSKSPPTGTGARLMLGSTTASWRIGFAALQPNAGFAIRRRSCSISPGAMIPEPIISVADPLSDDRRAPRMGLVGDGRAAGVHDVSAEHQTLALSAARNPCQPPPKGAKPRLAMGLPNGASALRVGGQAKEFPSHCADLGQISGDVVIAAAFAGGQMEAAVREGFGRSCAAEMDHRGQHLLLLLVGGRV